MSLNYSNKNNFLSSSKGKISNFIPNIQYSKNIQSSLDAPNSFLFKRNITSSYFNKEINFNNNLNKTNLDNSRNIDFYRNDYISNMEDKSQNFLGKKLNRDENIKKNISKINIPNDKRYHKTLIQDSLEKIRNEIKQKRLENINRMSELNERANKLDVYFRNNNNKGKYI